MVRTTLIQSLVKGKVKCFLLAYLFTALPSAAQDISQIAQSDPLVITGAVGTNNTYYHSSIGSGYQSPLSNSFYLNLNISIYGFSMPFSLYYTNDNMDFNYPHLSFNLNPRYKNWTGYIGLGSMSYSSYVLSMSFNGVGVEYDDGKRLRFGAWYGTLRNAVNDDPTDPSARDPQYKRVGYGFKVGYGNGNNYLDLYVLKAYERLKSLDEYWQQKIAPQDNVVVGVKGNVKPLKFLNLSANAAMSAFSTDTRVEEVPDGLVDNKWGKVFDTRYSSLARFAGDMNASLTFSKLTLGAMYRFIQPDYMSMGAYYMSNNYHSLGLTLTSAPINNLTLGATFSGQADNLSGKQLFTTKGYVYSASASTRIANLINLMAGYNGYTQVQSDGAAKVNDTTKVDRIMQSFTLTPSMSFSSDNLTHAISLSASLTDNKDRNKFATGESDVTSFAVGLSYALGVKPWDMDFNASLTHQESKGYHTKYISNIGSLTTGRNFLKDESLSVSATLNLIYNEVQGQSKSLSLGADMTMGYTLNKVHVFSLTAGMNKYGDVNVTKRRSSLDATDITASLSYAYTFSLLQIKNKKNPENKKK